MKKKFLSSILAAAMALSCTAAVMADDKTPSVYVDSSEIFFADQAHVILGEGTTLVPARGVFEAMGASVTWDGEARLVEVKSADNNTIVKLVIDDSTMRVYDMSGMFASLMMGQDFQAPETPVTLSVAPQIINDRTMIPLRAISEALQSEVKWDGEQYRIDILTGDAPTSVDTLPAYSMTASSAQVAAGETVDLYIVAKNIPADTFVSGVTATIDYDKESFEFVESALMNGETVIEGTIGASNADFTGGSLKTAHITINAETAVKADGTVMKVTFKSIDGSEGKFALSNGYHSTLGFNTSLQVDDGSNKSVLFSGNDFFVDTTEVVVNGADAE
ncbi:MAG: hypothetical protein IJX57_06955 [Clostridia bacterium]|nr:hypothetical protein [Clostridia bacterium]